MTNNFGPRKGQQKEVGEYALHVQCAWRIRGPDGIVVGSGDAEDRCDDRIREFLEARTYIVEQVAADTTGGMVISLADGFTLEVFPDHSLDDEYSEHWRLLRPGELGWDLVVSGGDIDLP